MTLAPGTTVGRYQILEPLGQGGMATVYKAFQPSLEREVALKVLRPGYAQDQEFRERFEREAKSIARLRHPHIVQVFDFEVSPSGEFVLAMEFLDGGTLKDRMVQLASAGGALDPAETVRILWEVADALSYAHEQGIVHRDVKPSNVMLARPRDRAVVTDFGIARILGATSHTQTGVGIGTPEYMAPEQGQGGAIDHRADIYSLGAMAYELLVGRVPFVADTPLAVVIAHIKDPLPLPSKVNPTIGQGVERALLKALAKDPAQRYDSAIAFAQALRDGLAEDTRGGTMPTIVVRGAAAVPAAAPARVASLPAPKHVTLAVPPILMQRPVVFGAAAALVVAVVAGTVVASGALRGSPAASSPPTVTAVTGAPSIGAAAPAAAASVLPTSPASSAASPPKFPVPAKGALIWEAKLDGVARDITNVSGGSGQSGIQVRQAVGAIEVAVIPTGTESGGASFNMPTRSTFVGELDLVAAPGANVSANWDFRYGARGERYYTVSLSTAKGSARISYVDKTVTPCCAHTDLSSEVALPGLSEGKTVTLAVVVEESRYTFFVNGRQEAKVTDTRLTQSTSAPSIWALPEKSDSPPRTARPPLRIIGARFYELPPSLVTQTVPARGLLAYEARLDGSGVDLTGEPRYEGIIRHVPGAIEVSAPTATTGFSAGRLNTEGSKARYVIEYAFSVDPGATVDFRAELYGAPGVQHMLRVNARTRSVSIVQPLPANQADQLTQTVPIAEMETGRIFWVAVVFDGKKYTLYVDQQQVAQSRELTLEANGIGNFGVRTWGGLSAGTGVVRVRALRIFDLP